MLDDTLIEQTNCILCALLVFDGCIDCNDALLSVGDVRFSDKSSHTSVAAVGLCSSPAVC